MEMKKQAMNCAFAAIQGEELLRECGAFCCSCAVYLCAFSRNQKVGVNGTSGGFPGHLLPPEKG